MFKYHVSLDMTLSAGASMTSGYLDLWVDCFKDHLADAWQVDKGESTF